MEVNNGKNMKVVLYSKMNYNLGRKHYLLRGGVGITGGVIGILTIFKSSIKGGVIGILHENTVATRVASIKRTINTQIMC